MTIRVLILAAGEGTRMRSEIPKVLHTVGGTPILHRVIRAIPDGVDGISVVLGRQFDDMRERLAREFPDIHLVHQSERLGTGHAVMTALNDPTIAEDILMVLPGDLPLLTTPTLSTVLPTLAEENSDAAVLAFEPDSPHGYGRIVTVDGRFGAIVEEKDADEAQRRIPTVNTGIYVFRTASLRKYLDTLSNSNAQGEYYLTDVPGQMARDGRSVTVVHAADPADFLGVNNRIQLATADNIAIQRNRERHMLNGVTLLNPDTIRIEDHVIIHRDTIIHPHCHITGHTVIESGTVLGQGTVLSDSKIGRNTRTLPYSVIHDATIGPDCQIGPMAHLRPGSVLAANVKVGNFVETKKVTLETGVKASHLTYLGDAEVGENSNIGAGTITCNYDGQNKHRTVIGKGVFIGSDSQLVAPVVIGEGAYVGAGSTITRDVPPDSLAISRARQTTIQDWAKKKKKKQKDKS